MSLMGLSMHCMGDTRSYSQYSRHQQIRRQKPHHKPLRNCVLFLRFPKAGDLKLTSGVECERLNFKQCRKYVKYIVKIVFIMKPCLP